MAHGTAQSHEHEQQHEVIGSGAAERAEGPAVLGCLPHLSSHAVLVQPDTGRSGAAAGIAGLVGLGSHAGDASCVRNTVQPLYLSEQVAAGA